MITPDLASIQQVFQRRVLGAAAGIESHVLSSVGANAAERVAVYVDAYRSRLLESLGKDFPGVRRLLGDAEFERLGREYIDAHPSDTRSIRWFGRHLPALLRRTRRDRPVVIEMADFEWQQGEVFDAPEAGRTTEAEFAAVPADAWPLMRLTFHPSMRRLDLAWNVVEYWQAINDKGPRRFRPFPPGTFRGCCGIDRWRCTGARWLSMKRRLWTLHWKGARSARSASGSQISRPARRLHGPRVC